MLSSLIDFPPREQFERIPKIGYFEFSKTLLRGVTGHIKAKTLISNHAAVELQQIEQENHKVYVHKINEQCPVFVLDMIK